jgi:hypothetical protein
MAEEETADQPPATPPESPEKTPSPLHQMLTSIALERKKVTFGQTDSGLLYLP